MNNQHSLTAEIVNTLLEEYPEFADSNDETVKLIIGHAMNYDGDFQQTLKEKLGIFSEDQTEEKELCRIQVTEERRGLLSMGKGDWIMIGMIGGMIIVGNMMY